MNATVQILERKFGHFPVKFKLIGDNQVLEIDAVERCWTEMRRKRGQARYHFQVRCGAAHYQLSQDIDSGLWTVQQEE